MEELFNFHFKRIIYKRLIKIKYTLKTNISYLSLEFYLLNRERKNRILVNSSKRMISIDYRLLLGQYDLYAKIEIKKNQYIEIRVFNVQLYKRVFIKEKIYKNRNISYHIRPSVSSKANYLYFTVSKFDYRNIQIFKKAHISKTGKYLILEQKNRASDNGYVFFKYLIANKICAFYLIDPNCLDFLKLKGLQNIVFFDSSEHYRLLKECTHIVSTHHANYSFPFNSKVFERELKYKTHIFLQHGIMGMKKMDNFYGKYVNSFNPDLFVVSSEYEKKIICNDFRYKPENVIVTGLSRFDTLLDNSVHIENNSILIMPTWRDWLTGCDLNQFKTSEYYLKFKSLIDLLIVKFPNFNISLFLHINMQPFINTFDIPGINLIRFGEADVQFLLKKFQILITDYSSVGFDFSFLKKPVLYFHFDKDRFIGYKGSHFEINSDLPGTIYNHERNLVDVLSDYYNGNNNILPITKSKLYDFYDTRNSERLYTEIKNFKSKKYDYFYRYKTFFYLLDNSNMKIVNKFYQILFNIMNTICLKKKIVFIESSLGINFEDSPKVIFDNWKKRNDDILFVIVCNKFIEERKEDNVIVVSRFSFLYYYFLSRAKIIINNQNFSYKLRINKSQIYLQTWHGSPIKKMQNDLNKIVGRRKGYLDRINKASSYWDLLLTDSIYTSEKFKSAFNYNNRFLEYGFPRHELLFDNNRINEIKLKYSNQVDFSKKIVLIAPTFREFNKKINNKYQADNVYNFALLYQKFKEDYIFIYKPHILEVNNYNFSLFPNFIIDMSDKDINELICISDILVTDYSSVMFDFSRMKKRIILFAYDYDKYVNQTRGLYLDIMKDLPFEIVFHFDELIKKLSDTTIKIKYGSSYINRFQSYLPETDNIINELKRLASWD